MSPIKVILVDDNHDSIEIIRFFMEDIPGFQIVTSCENGDEMVEQVMINKPDLVLADINMPKKNGMQAVKECRSFYPDMKFIFFTGYDEYAVEAFELAAVDYIVKPVEKQRFVKALERAKQVIQFERGMEKDDQDPHQEKPGILRLKDVNSVHYIPLEVIYFIEKSGKKCFVYTKWGIYETNETIARIVKKLDDSFCQTHRSNIINLKLVSQITPYNETFLVQFKNYDKQASISKLKIQEVRERLPY